MDNPNYKSGFVALIGRPNVGKSTLLNQVIGQKVAIMSDVAQTTRNKIQGIYTTDEAQIVFIDTPGIHKPQTKLGDFMERSSLSALDEVDAILFVINATENKGAGDNFIIERLKKVHQPIYLIINKIDQVHPDRLLAIMDQYKDSLKWEQVLPISALQGNNVTEMLQELVKKYAKIATPLKNITPHKLRSTYGTNLYKETNDIYIVAEVLGHKDVNTTKKHYAAISDDIRKSVAGKVKLNNQ